MSETSLSKDELTVEYLLGDDGETKACPNCGFSTKRKNSDFDVKREIEDVKRELRQRSEANKKNTYLPSEEAEIELNDEDDDSSVISVSLNPIEELPIITSPFQSSQSEERKGYVKWRAPAFLQPEREKLFNWERPWGVDESVNDTPAQRARRLEQTIEEKDRDLDALRKQYRKAQRENYTLAEEIRSFKGDHYDELKVENARLKEAHGRVSRENLWLRGQFKRLNNGKITELEEKRKIDLKYGAKSYPKRK